MNILKESNDVIVELVIIEIIVNNAPAIAAWQGELQLSTISSVKIYLYK